MTLGTVKDVIGRSPGTCQTSSRARVIWGARATQAMGAMKSADLAAVAETEAAPSGGHIVNELGLTIEEGAGDRHQADSNVAQRPTWVSIRAVTSGGPGSA